MMPLEVTIPSSEQQLFKISAALDKEVLYFPKESSPISFFINLPAFALSAFTIAV